jgi:hypothetical protein
LVFVRLIQIQFIIIAMKSTVCSLFAALFIVTLIASCDSSTSANTEEGTRIGTWMVYESQQRGDWVGKESSNKAKTAGYTTEGDSIFIDQPGDRELYFEDKGDHYKIYYTDYTFSATTFDTTNADKITLPNPGIFTGGTAFGRTNDYIAVNTAIIDMQCSQANTASADTFKVHWLNEDGSLFKAIHLDISGIVDAIKTTKGC